MKTITCGRLDSSMQPCICQNGLLNSVLEVTQQNPIHT